MLRVFSFNSRILRVDIEFGFTPLFKKGGYFINLAGLPDKS
jgi:hypothetical protein